MSLMLRIFAFNKQLVLILLMGLAITSLILSALGISYLYIGDTANLLVSKLPYHMILFYGGKSDPWILENEVNKLFSRSEISGYINVYVESFRGSNHVLMINDTLVNVSSYSISIIYYPGLHHNYSVLMINPRNPLLRNITRISGFTRVVFSNKTIIYMYVTNSFSTVYDSLSRAYINILKSRGLYISGSTAGLENPYILIYNSIVRERSYYSYDLSMILLTGDRGYFIKLSRRLSQILVSNTISIYGHKTVITPSGFSSTSIYYGIRSGKLLLSIIFFNPKKVVSGLSIEASIGRIENIIGDLTGIDHGVISGVFDDRITYHLASYRMTEQLIRLSTIVALLPSLVIIWLSASKIPPTIVSTMRKIIALLRIRGVSITRIRNTVLYSIIIWVIAGGIIGVPLGPLLSLILYHGIGGVGEYYDLSSMLMDPLTIALAIGTELAIMLGSLSSTFRMLRSIEPSEFTKPTILTELPFISRGIGKGTWILLVLSIYYVIRVFNIVNPLRILATTNPNPLTIIAGVLMLMLEPIISFFGPVILIYTIAKLLIAYPDKLSSLISGIAGWISREYKVLVSRLVMIKPAHIALLIVLGTFSTGILLGGLVGVNSVNAMYTSTYYALTGGVDYVLYRPVTISSINQLIGYVRNASSLINGSYTYALLVIGTNKSSIMGFNRIIRWNTRTYIVYDTLYLGNPVNTYTWILFIPDNYSSIVKIYDGLGYDSSTHRYFSIIHSVRDSAILVNNIAAVRRGDATGVKNPYSGWGRLLLDNKYFSRINIVGTIRNIPGVKCFSTPSFLEYMFRERSVSYGANAEIELVYPTRPGLIMSMKMLGEYIESAKQKGYGLVGFLFILVRGSVKASSIHGFDMDSLSSTRDSIDTIIKYMVMGFDNNIAMGLSLFIITLIIIAMVTYTIIYENLYTYTLMRGRGVSRDKVYRLCFAEVFSISLISILPGLFIGLFLGYGLQSMTMQYAYTAQPMSLTDVYGVSFTLMINTWFIIYSATIFLLPILLAMILVRKLYGRVEREAISLIGSHV